MSIIRPTLSGYLFGHLRNYPSKYFFNYANRSSNHQPCLDANRIISLLLNRTTWYFGNITYQPNYLRKIASRGSIWADCSMTLFLLDAMVAELRSSDWFIPLHLLRVWKSSLKLRIVMLIWSFFASRKARD